MSEAGTGTGASEVVTGVAVFAVPLPCPVVFRVVVNGDGRSDVPELALAAAGEARASASMTATTAGMRIRRE
jgi:hypothetical protein